MSRSEIEQVLRNWIERAISPDGVFPEGTDRAKWVGDNFLAWFRAQANDSLDSAELAAHRLRDQLKRAGTAKELDGALHELALVQEALSDLRQDLGLSSESTEGT